MRVKARQASADRLVKDAGGVGGHICPSLWGMLMTGRYLLFGQSPGKKKAEEMRPTANPSAVKATLAAEDSAGRCSKKR